MEQYSIQSGALYESLHFLNLVCHHICNGEVIFYNDYTGCKN